MLRLENNFILLKYSQEAELKKHQVVLKKGFDKDDGVFVCSLDDALASFNVERQAYHGGSFIGNHIHRALKVSNNNLSS